jgi:two-component system, OmpR family, sensor kinase
MARRLLPGGLRGQLALAIALVTTFALGLSFVAVYRGTGARLRDRIDEDLTTQVAEWDRERAAAELSAPEEVKRFAQRFIDSQSYYPASRVFVVDAAGVKPVTNQPRILEEEEEEAREHAGESDEHDEHDDGLLNAPIGLSDASVEEAGHMRVLTRPITSEGRRIGTLYVADPLTPITDAQASLLRTFALVGSLALALAVAAGVLIATLIARPLQRMAAVAAAVDTGDLSLRAGAVGARGEVGVLASAFDHMLERLERAFARQRDFVSDASHELRTPLAVLRAQVELLGRETDVRVRHEDTRLLLRRLDEMDRLVDDLLTLAGAEAGRLVQPRRIELVDYFEDVRRDLPLFGERDFHVEPVDGVLEADPDRLTQVLRNLVRNAVAHTESGGRVGVVASVREGWLAIAVSDDGPGIPPEHLERVFERFHRVDESRAREHGGTGLGLAIARAIVEAHGGRIRAESRTGGGTTITLELPGYRPATTGAGVGR